MEKKFNVLWIIFLFCLNMLFNAYLYTDLKQFNSMTRLQIDYSTKLIHNNLQNIEKILKKAQNKIEFNKIKNANVIIYNRTNNRAGSGTIIKINSKYYVLTCGHLITKMNEELIITGNFGLKKLELVKVNLEKDLSLFSLDITGEIDYSEICQKEINVGQHIYTVGNPANLEDVITDGIISNIDDNFIYVTAPIFCGNSGGALYNDDGEIIGVVIQLQGYVEGIIVYSQSACVKLDTIREFLKEVK